MKHIRITLILTTMLAFGTTGCGILQQQADEVKVIPKPSAEGTVQLYPDNTSKPDDSLKSPNNDLDGKLQSLQTDTENLTKSVIESRALEVLSAIKSEDMAKLSQMVHPDKGVRFSPYGHVNTSSDLVFNADRLQDISSDKKVYTWGIHDGSGLPIDLTFGDYYKKFIYDKDFINAKEVGYNKILGKGNMVNNSFEVYTNAVIVEYHFPGFDKQYGGMDWESLKLVFEKKESTWFIVGIIHDQWTI